MALFATMRFGDFNRGAPPPASSKGFRTYMGKRSGRTGRRAADGAGSATEGSSAWNHAVVAAALVVVLAAVFFAYAPAIRGGFVWDDDAYVENNEALRSGEGLWRIWTDFEATPQYYPLVHTSFWIEYHLWGLDASGYHVVNVFLHGLAVVLLWRVLLRLGVPWAWVAAAVFALHPIQVESVAWITERKNVLSGVFYLGSALAFLRWAKLGMSGMSGMSGSAGRGAARFYVLSLVLFVCALLSKTVTCTLPAALLLVLWWKDRLDGRRAMSLLPFFVIGVGMGLVTVWLERHHVGAMGEAWELSFLERCLLACRIVCFYATTLLWPAGLTFVYPRWEVDASRVWWYVYPGMVVVTTWAAWLGRRRMGRGAVVGLLYFGGTLFPALGFFDVYPMRYSYVADHFQYLAGVGFITLVTAGVLGWFGQGGSRRRVAVLTGVGVLLSGLGVLSWGQAKIYRDIDTLWEDTLAKNPKAWMAHNNLGHRLYFRGRLDEAIGHFEEALAVKDELPETHNNLGKALEARGRVDEAVAHFETALEINPRYAEAMNNLGGALGAKGRMREAADYFHRTIALDPTHAKAHFNLGMVYKSRQSYAQAMDELAQALTLRPELPEAHFELGGLLEMEGHPRGAAEHYGRAIALRPDYIAARRALRRLQRPTGGSAG